MTCGVATISLHACAKIPICRIAQHNLVHCCMYMFTEREAAAFPPYTPIFKLLLPPQGKPLCLCGVVT